MQLHINIILFQQAVEVRDLRHDADRTNDGKGRGHNAIRHAGHPVTAAGGDFVYRDRQANAAGTQTGQLR
ncbi:hypothetical protein D3C86_2005610 [compost metagenome]